MEKVIKEYGKLFVCTTESKLSKDIDILDFPQFKRSILQYDNLKLMFKLDNTTLVESRRIGKTTSTADFFYQYHIMEGDLMKRSSLSILAHPQAQELKDRFYNKALIQPFGNKEGLLGESLDNVYIRLPNRYKKYLFADGDFQKGYNENLNSADFEWFFEPFNKAGDRLIVMPHFEDDVYVKLFRDNIGSTASSKNADGLCRGRLFNGATIELVSANHNFDKYVSGNAVNFLWGEELGTWASNYISKVAIQAVLQRKGKIVSTLTPDKKNPDPSQHWTYKDIIEPVLSDSETKHSFVHGLNIYINNSGVSTPVERDGKTVEEKQGTTQGVVIAKLTECFPYSHDNQIYFSNVVSSLNEKVIPHWKKDENGEYIKSDTNTFILESLEYTGIRKAGSIDMNDWYREYEMSFEGIGSTNCFPSFGNHNILSYEHKEYFEKNFPTIVGFDKGMALVDEANQTIIQKDGSVTIFIYIAKVNKNQWVVYDEYIMNYDYDAVGKKILQEVRKKRPVVYDSVLKNTISKIGSKANSDIYQICLATPELSKEYRGGLYHRCLIPSHKREMLTKIVDYDKMFQTKTNLINPVNHPLDETQDGCRLYVLEHCKNVIEYFQKQKWKISKEGEFIVKNNERVPDDNIRNDAFDALTYSIDLYNLGVQANTRKQYSQIVDEIWRDTRLEANINKLNMAIPRGYNITVFGRQQNKKIW